MSQAFTDAEATLGGAVDALGVPHEGSSGVSCSDQRRSRLQTEAYCSSARGYRYTDRPLSEADRRAYPDKAKHLDELLAAHGWESDRPHDNYVTAVQIDPHSPANNGEGGTLVFHKNIGSVSCNLRIMYDGLNTELSPSPNTLNVDQFSCQKIIHYPKFNLFDYKFEGA